VVGGGTETEKGWGLSGWTVEMALGARSFGRIGIRDWSSWTRRWCTGDQWGRLRVVTRVQAVGEIVLVSNKKRKIL